MWLLIQASKQESSVLWPQPALCRTEGASVAALSGLCNRYGSQRNLAGSIESLR